MSTTVLIIDPLKHLLDLGYKGQPFSAGVDTVAETIGE